MRKRRPTLLEHGLEARQGGVAPNAPQQLQLGGPPSKIGKEIKFPSLCTIVANKLHYDRLASISNPTRSQGAANPRSNTHDTRPAFASEARQVNVHKVL